MWYIFGFWGTVPGIGENYRAIAVAWFVGLGAFTASDYRKKAGEGQV